MTATRRAVLARAAGAALFPLAPAAAAPAALRDIAAARGLTYGTYIRAEMLGSDRDYTGLVEREAGLVVCSCAHWRHLAPTPTTVDYSGVEKVYDWAVAHRMKYRGHALVWGEAAPAWFAELPSRAAAERALVGHIAGVCRHFAGRFQSWDVVNEAIRSGDGRPDHLRKTVFLDKIGPEYLDLAFNAARAADPKTRLVYNDFDVEFDTPYQREKRRAVLDLVDGFKKRGTPLDAVGIQSHIATARMRDFDARVLADFLQALSDRGLEIMLTELDVVDRGAPSAIPARDEEVAACYRRYLDVALANPAVSTVISWGLTDRNSWITAGRDPETRRSDGLPPRPLAFDTECRKKPAYDAIAAALAAAPRRRSPAG
jgi:endo-1,4-beta-xylanase